MSTPVETAPDEPGLAHRVGEPFAYALGGSPVRWALVVVSGALLAIAALTRGPLTGDTVSGPGTTLAWALLLAVLPLLVAVDAAIHMLPNRVLYPVGLGAVMLVTGDWMTGGIDGPALLRAVGVAVGLLVFSLAVVLIAPAGGYGLGDVRMVTVAGFVLGTHSALLPVVALVVVPPLVGLPVALVALAASRGKTTGIAFGPCIAVGIVLAAFGPHLLAPLL